MFKYIKYLLPFTLYVLAYLSFTNTGWVCWLAPALVWFIIPMLELVLPQNLLNPTAAEEEMAKHDKVYDYLLYAIVLLLIPSLILFLQGFVTSNLDTPTIIARVWTMGILCGTFGINVAHELGHRVKRGEQVLAQVGLLTSLYMHFFVEHNKGHHKHVATPHDPSSARYNEPVYTFFYRTVVHGYKSAWSIANAEAVKANKPKFSLHNSMVRITLIQISFVLAIYFCFGLNATLYFAMAAAIGALSLETINYIEHYGLQRKVTATGNYERTMPHHSWNSSHPIGRLMLFELSRHSDHHYLASRKYQILRHHDTAPQLPTGYPGSMLLSLFPPLWFKVMHKRIAALENKTVFAN